MTKSEDNQCGVSKVVAKKEVLILCRGLQSQRDEMFIEPRDHPDFKSSGGATYTKPFPSPVLEWY
jgi:hypothetical protein